MTKSLLSFAVMFGCGSSLIAWDFRCVGEGVSFNYSRETRPYLEVEGRGFYLEASEKKWEGEGFVLSGKTHDSSYITYSLWLQCVSSSSFATSIELLNNDKPRKKLTMTCYFSPSHQ